VASSAETAAKGSSQIKVDGTVNWRSGQLIATRNDGVERRTHEPERGQEYQHSGDRTRITLDKPLEYQHYGYAAPSIYLSSDHTAVSCTSSAYAVPLDLALDRTVSAPLETLLMC
jgi:hypothetical protein